jgi:trehalose 6-phosphate phosphatase
VKRNILAARNSEALRDIAASGGLLAFDFDGTLAPFDSTDPSATQMRGETMELLRSLAHCAPVAVITGRAVSDVASRLVGVPLLAIVGNHGVEPSAFARKASNAVARWIPQLDALVAAYPHLIIENKRYSISVHYRNVTSRVDAIAAVMALVPLLPGKVAAVHGTDLINLMPAGAPNKGDAMRAVIGAHSLPCALFVGDELTDEPAFAAATASRGFGVRVGRWSETAAEYFVPAQTDVDALLTELLVGRTRPRRDRVVTVSATSKLASATHRPKYESV